MGSLVARATGTGRFEIKFFLSSSTSGPFGKEIVFCNCFGLRIRNNYQTSISGPFEKEIVWWFRNQNNFSGIKQFFWNQQFSVRISPRASWKRNCFANGRFLWFLGPPKVIAFPLVFKAKTQVWFPMRKYMIHNGFGAPSLTFLQIPVNFICVL